MTRGTTPTIKVSAKKEWLDAGSKATIWFNDSKGGFIWFDNPPVEKQIVVEETETTAEEAAYWFVCSFEQQQTTCLIPGYIKVEVQYNFNDGSVAKVTGGGTTMREAAHTIINGNKNSSQCTDVDYVDLNVEDAVVVVAEGTKNYEELENRPMINGIVIEGDQTPEYYGISESTYTNELPTSVEVGGVPVGTVFTDKPISEIFDMLFYKEFFPSFTAPFVQGAFNDYLVEVGLSSSITLEVTANRGKIDPSFGTSGYRAGLPSQLLYTITGNDEVAALVTPIVETSSIKDNQTIEFTFLEPDSVTFTPGVNFTAGEQPKSSQNKDFDAPYPEQIVSGTPRTLNAVLPYFATTSTISQLTKALSLITTVIEVNMAGEVNGFKQTIEFPSTFTVTGINVLNDISGTWDPISVSNFTEEIFEKDINGLTFEYKRLTHNSIQIGERSLRFLVTA